MSGSISNLARADLTAPQLYPSPPTEQAPFGASSFPALAGSSLAHSNKFPNDFGHRTSYPEHQIEVRHKKIYFKLSDVLSEATSVAQRAELICRKIFESTFKVEFGIEKEEIDSDLSAYLKKLGINFKVYKREYCLCAKQLACARGMQHRNPDSTDYQISMSMLRRDQDSKILDSLSDNYMNLMNNIKSNTTQVRCLEGKSLDFHAMKLSLSGMELTPFLEFAEKYLTENDMRILQEILYTGDAAKTIVVQKLPYQNLLKKLFLVEGFNTVKHVLMAYQLKYSDPLNRNVEINHGKLIQDADYNAFKKQQDCDTEFLLGKKKLSFHKFKLARCPLIKMLMTRHSENGIKEANQIKIPGVKSLDALKLVIKYYYNDIFEVDKINEELIVDVLSICLFLQDEVLAQHVAIEIARRFKNFSESTDDPRKKQRCTLLLNQILGRHNLFASFTTAPLLVLGAVLDDESHLLLWNEIKSVFK